MKILIALLLLIASNDVFAMDVVNEKSTWVVSMSFFDETKAAATPSGGTYRVDDIGSGASIVASTPFTPSSSTYQIVITPTQNALQNANDDAETRRLTVIWQYGGTKQGTAEYIYQIENLPGVN